MTPEDAPPTRSAPAAQAPRESRRDLQAPGGVEGLQFPDIPRLELDQLLEQLRDRAEDVLATQGRLRRLLRANAAVAADLSLPVLLRHIVDAARDLLRARYAAIGVNGRDGQLQQFVHAGMDADAVVLIGALRTTRGVQEWLTAQAAQDRRPEPPAQPSSAGFEPLHPPVGGFLGVPIRVGNEVFGELFLRAGAGGVFTSDDEQLVTALAATAGVAIANARLFTESEQRRRWLTASSDLTNRLLAADTVHPLDWVTRGAVTAADADVATVVVANGTDEVAVAAATGVQASEVLGRTADMDESPAGRIMRTGKAVLITEYRTEADPLAMGGDIGPMMLVPLTAGERTYGALTLGRVAGREGFTPADLGMAASFGTHAAVALALADAHDTELRVARLEDHDRIAFDLHDHVIGELFALGIGLQRLAGVTDTTTRIARINGYIDSLDRVVGTIRTTIFQLQPHNPAGLQARIVHIAQTHTEQLGFPPHLRFAGPIDLVVDEPLAADVLAVTREALSNCARHAHATIVDVSVSVAHDVLTLQVTDNGHGIGTPTRSSGLTNMRRRAERHAGHLDITEPATGGTRLTWSAVIPSRQPATDGPVPDGNATP